MQSPVPSRTRGDPARSVADSPATSGDPLSTATEPGLRRKSPAAGLAQTDAGAVVRFPAPEAADGQSSVAPTWLGTRLVRQISFAAPAADELALTIEFVI